MSVFANDFRHLNKDDEKLIKEFFDGYNYDGAAYTYIATYIWSTSFCISWEIIEGYLCMAGTTCTDPTADVFMSMPLVRGNSEPDERYRSEYEPESLKTAILKCREKFAEAGKPFIFTSIPGHLIPVLKDAFGDDIDFVHGDDWDEYIYLKEKLIDLSGRALHKKKNHLNFFLRNYEFEAKPIANVERCDILKLASAIKDFKSQDPDEVADLEGEFMAMEQILDIIEEGCDRVYGVGIYIKGNLEAFAIGEVISENMAAEHFEKANDQFRGLYQLVCREFCKLLPESVVYVNREEDMGLPNLRQAKEALKPDHMSERYSAIIK